MVKYETRIALTGGRESPLRKVASFLPFVLRGRKQPLWLES